MKNKWLWVGVVLAVLYLADAAYPRWGWQCSAIGEFNVINHIPEVAEDPQMGDANRHFRLTLPPGCEADPSNLLRKLVEWVAPINKKVTR